MLVNLSGIHMDFFFFYDISLHECRSYCEYVLVYSERNSVFLYCLPLSNVKGSITLSQAITNLDLHVITQIWNLLFSALFFSKQKNIGFFWSLWSW